LGASQSVRKNPWTRGNQNECGKQGKRTQTAKTKMEREQWVSRSAMCRGTQALKPVKKKGKTLMRAQLVWAGAEKNRSRGEEAWEGKTVRKYFKRRITDQQKKGSTQVFRRAPKKKKRFGEARIIRPAKRENTQHENGGSKKNAAVSSIPKTTPSMPGQLSVLSEGGMPGQPNDAGRHEEPDLKKKESLAENLHGEGRGKETLSR